ncbi:hypothetical protein GCM10027451_08310 [Geodermatophilus aquaeductus]|uniref:Uncharacterized protein n=2 Tax=Geodermatophilus aquaeductus TaxID=1564161 RepID=A0A521DH46_9ACTN|nr:hypothetical protein SAMN06273567_103192 [Geodermatophilus aquaeductus]
MPGTAIAAAGIGALGVLPLTLVTVLPFLLGGVQSDDIRDWWVYALLLLPVLQVFGVVWLVSRRGRWPLVAGAVASLVFALLVIGTAVSVGSDVGATPVIVAVCPLVAAVLAFHPRVTAWLAGRRRAG